MTTFLHLSEKRDERGRLAVLDQIPFPVKRVFTIDQARGTRGGHAHRTCQQIIIALRGAFTVSIGTHVYRLNDPLVALWVLPMEFIEMGGWEGNALALVLCSEHYDPEDYIYARNLS